MITRSTASRLASAAASVVLAATPFATGPASAATISSAATSGSPGKCADDARVTVVVDFRALGGNVVVRCAGSGGDGYTGLDALTDAGFSVTGTQRWGMAFVCRIQGRPSAHESLSIPGDDDYHETCADTPPDTAYWGYWYATNGGSWEYSSTAAATRDTIKGGFEGWAFHLGSGAAKPPGLAPRHRVATTAPTPTQSQSPTDASPSQAGGSTPGKGAAASDSSTSASDRNSTGPSATGDDRSRRPRHGQSNGGRPSRPEPNSTTATSAPAARQIATELPAEPDDGSGSATPLLVGAGVLALLGLGAGVTAWRRSRRG